MSIGRGWYEDVMGEIEEDKAKKLATELLQNKLTEIFAISAENFRRERDAAS